VRKSSKENKISDPPCVMVFSDFPDMTSLDEDQYYKEEDEHTATHPTTHEEEKNMDSSDIHKEGENYIENTPANEKTGNYYKDIKQCKFLKLITICKKLTQQAKCTSWFDLS
jgi:hypothetical protein